MNRTNSQLQKNHYRGNITEARSDIVAVVTATDVWTNRVYRGASLIKWKKNLWNYVQNVIYRRATKIQLTINLDYKYFQLNLGIKHNNHNIVLTSKLRGLVRAYDSLSTRAQSFVYPDYCWLAFQPSIQLQERRNKFWMIFPGLCSALGCYFIPILRVFVSRIECLSVLITQVLSLISLTILAARCRIFIVIPPGLLTPCYLSCEFIAWVEQKSPPPLFLFFLVFMLILGWKNYYVFLC